MQRETTQRNDLRNIKLFHLSSQMCNSLIYNLEQLQKSFPVIYCGVNQSALEKKTRITERTHCEGNTNLSSVGSSALLSSTFSSSVVDSALSSSSECVIAELLRQNSMKTLI